jgi:hypothetical protein
MRKLGRGAAAAAGLAAGLLAAGCSVATPDTSQIGLHYSGGPFSSQEFVNCIQPGVREVDGPEEHYYFYPHGRRTFDFTGGPNSDSGPLMVSTKNSTNNTSTEVAVRGILTLTLTEDCSPWTDPEGKVWKGGKLQAFHDMIGRQHRAFADDGDPMPPAWRDAILLPYVGGSMEKALDNVGPAHDWNRLATSADERNALQSEAFNQLIDAPNKPGLLTQAVGGPFFTVHSLQIVSVDPPKGLKDAQDQVQIAQTAADAVAIDERTAANFPGGIMAYMDYRLKLAYMKALDQGRGIPVPTGSSVIIPAR